MSSNGYISIEINGEKIGLKFGMPAIRQFADKLKKRKLMTDGSYNEMGIAHIIYAGYCCNCEIKDEDPEIKFEVFYSFVEAAIKDESKLQVIKNVINCFEGSQFVKEMVDNINSAQDTSKKNSGSGRKLKPSAMENSASLPGSTSG